MVLAFVLALALQTTHTSPAQPYDSALEARTREVASVLRCPVCQGLSIQDSPSELSLQMKDVVRQQLKAGKSPEEVKAYFVSKYGEWILMEPTRKGFNWAVYLLPVAVVAAGAGVIVMAVRRWTRARPPGDEGAERSPLEEELEDEWDDDPADVRGR